MACELGPLITEANQAAAASYAVCDVDPSAFTLTPSQLSIIEEGNWCQWQPTYDVPDISGYIPSITTGIKNIVYEELWADLMAKIAELEANAAMVYSTKIERVTDTEALAGQIQASYAQWQSGSQALTTWAQTAFASQNMALSEQISTTYATLDSKVTANSTFYQSSLATVNETMAASGVLNSVTLADGKKVVSGFRSEASSTEGSSFVIFADRFEILNRVPNGTGGYDYGTSVVPFSVENGVVHIGEVDTGEPQITFIGPFASAALAAASVPVLKKNMVYKNTIDGKTYIYSGTAWAVWIENGANGADGADGLDGRDGVDGDNGVPGAAGVRGSGKIYVTGVGSAAAAESNFASAYPGTGTYPYNRVRGDCVVFTGNSITAASEWYRITEGSTTWSSAAQYINGNLFVTGSVNSNALSATAISGKTIRIDDTSTAGSTVNGGSLGWFGTTVNFNGLTGETSVNGGHGVYGWNHNTSGGAGVGGTGYYGGYFTGSNHGVVGITTGSGYGLYTANDAYIGGTVYSFTGSHIAYTQDELIEGQLVYAIDAWAISMNQTLMHVGKTTTAKDRQVLGIVTRVKDTLLDNITDNPLVKPEHQPYIDYMIENNFKEVNINSLGEGGILVCSENGNIDNGDYLTSANLAGYACKQDDDLLHSYTVAKALESVDWANETETTKLIACTYHAG